LIDATIKRIARKAMAREIEAGMANHLSCVCPGVQIVGMSIWMRPISATLVAASVLLTLGACGNSGAGATNGAADVNVYNWADYIAPDTIERFEAEFGFGNSDSCPARIQFRQTIFSISSSYISGSV
jgi:hypothetical protein